ncbi:uncharacterized protein EV154DRAFT_470207 [Mucor mucedo]|uniref:uncharacterized protein n=1 Tax=Mucor mucedo TaxID=29922 RepID=UPI00221EECE4|nr:uncharacterized protein EV154DRAFT_470207 [Mucor mucedo]KAI7887602.1 hypothetical protein EV154DRAFT_470207 [Mucor mucedo]
MAKMETQGFQYKLWNRDLAACLNMISIILNLRNTGQIPERFARHVHSKRRPRMGE